MASVDDRHIELNRAVRLIWTNTLANVAPPNLSSLWREHIEIRRVFTQIRQLQQPPSTRPIADRRQQLPAFLDWSTKADINYANTVSIVECSTVDGFGLRIDRNTDINDVLIRVPRRAMLSWDCARQSPALHLLFESDEMLRNMDNVALAMYLAIETMRGDQSQWSQYIDILPSTFHTPLFFTESQMQSLRPSPMFDESLRMYRAVARQFIYFHMIIQDNLFAMPITIDNFTFDLYRWSVACVCTRVNMIPSALIRLADNQPKMIPALIPVLDMANHECDDKIACSVQFSIETDAAECIANRRYSCDDALTIFYGRRSNADHLLHNGFVPTTNAYDYYKLKLAPPLNAKGEPNRARIDALKRSGFSQSTGIFRLTTSIPPIDDQLLVYVSTIITTTDHSTPTGAQRDIWQYLHDRLQSLLNAYKLTESTITADDGQRLASVDALKAGERRILESTLNYVDDQLHESMK